MSPGTNPPPLYILACDHRASFRRALFGDATLTPGILARTQDVKRIVADGLAWAVAQGVARSSAGLLMDTETGSDALAVVRSWSIRIAIPVERAGEERYSSSITAVRTGNTSKGMTRTT